MLGLSAFDDRIWAQPATTLHDFLKLYKPFPSIYTKKKLACIDIKKAPDDRLFVAVVVEGYVEVWKGKGVYSLINTRAVHEFLNNKR